MTRTCKSRANLQYTQRSVFSAEKRRLSGTQDGQVTFTPAPCVQSYRLCPSARLENRDEKEWYVHTEQYTSMHLYPPGVENWGL